MKCVDLIRWAMQMSDKGTAGMVEELRNAPLTAPTPRGGNHPVWVLGHLAWIEGLIPHVIRGEKNPVEHWAPLFGTGTEPKNDPSLYPSFDELLRTYRDLRARNLKLLEEIGEQGLDQTPKSIPPGFEEAMRTIGQTFLLLSLHNMVHYGQIADARRAAGLKPKI